MLQFAKNRLKRGMLLALHKVQTKIMIFMQCLPIKMHLQIMRENQKSNSFYVNK